MPRPAPPGELRADASDDFRTLLFCALIGLAVAAYFAQVMFLPAGGLRDNSDAHIVGRDFVNVWLGGSLALDGQLATLFDLASYNDLLKRLFGTPFDQHNWSYPPQALIFCIPFALLPYPAALVLWHAAGLALFVFAILGAVPRAQRRWAILLAIAAPATAVTLLTGQNGLITGGLFILAMRLLGRRPLTAGVVIGLLTIKPHLGLLLALCLLATGAWRAIASAAVTTAVLVGVSVALFGLEPWADWWTKAMPVQTWLLETMQGGYAFMMPTLFAGLRLAGLGYEAALAVHGALALAAALAVVYAVRVAASPALRATLIAAGTLLVSPYAFNYDMTWLVGALIWLVAETGRTSAAERITFGVVFLTPSVMMLLHAAGIVFAPIALVAILILALRRAIANASGARAVQWIAQR